MIMLLAGLRSFGQTADLSGIVLDPSKLAVPNAQVVVQNAETAATRTALSNQQGSYSVLALPPGRYNITVEANGFKTIHQEGVVLEVDQEARLDFSSRKKRSAPAFGPVCARCARARAGRWT